MTATNLPTIKSLSFSPRSQQLLPPIVSNALRSNLAIALYLLPSNRRKDALLFYKFCHDIDERIDDPSLTYDEKEAFLKTALYPLAELIERHQLDRTLFHNIIQGMEMDLTINRYQTFEELCEYAWKVASAVGLVSTQLFGANEKNSNIYAEHLGIALQLTNILRDVAEDAMRNRIYIPLEDLERFNVTEKEILQNLPSPQVTHLFHYQAARALSYFAKANLAWQKIPSTERHLMRPARLMEAIYCKLLEKMKRDGYDVLHQRYRVEAIEKLILIAQLLWNKI